MRRVIYLTVVVLLTTATVAQIRRTNPHQLSESIAAKGNELCAKVAGTAKTRRCEEVFGQVALEASLVELRAMISEESAADRDIQNEFISIRIQFNDAINAYSK